MDGMTKIKRFKKEAVPADTCVGEHARHRLRLPGGGQSGLRPFHPVRHPLPADAGPGHAQVHQQARLHHVRFCRRGRLPRRRWELAEGGIVMEPAKKKKYEPRRLLALDINDHIDPTTREWITVDENGNMVFPEASRAEERPSWVPASRLGCWSRPRLTPRTSRNAGCVSRQPDTRQRRHAGRIHARTLRLLPDVLPDGRPTMRRARLRRRRTLGEPVGVAQCRRLRRR